MTVRVTREAEPQFDLFGAYEGEVLGGAENTLAHLTFTASGDYLIVVPKNDLSQPQVEVGDTPSSYIPTNGSTVTRAGETLTAPSDNLPWPEPVVIGTLIDDDFTSYADQAEAEAAGYVFTSCAFDAANDQIDFSGVSANVRFDGAFDPADSAGSVYQVTFTVSNYVSGSLSFQDAFSTVGAAISANGTFTRTYVKSGVSSNVRLVTSNFEGSIDNVSVREINPLAVSIAMEGEVTYADEGIAFDVSYFYWAADANNLIRAGLNTFGGAVGNARFQQRDSAVVDEVQSTAYSPGVNVPFSIASRHGSTFINGAVDGTALTADTTPTALPDLETTDLDIGPDFMGTIKSIRIWADDIGDSGIEEASS